MLERPQGSAASLGSRRPRRSGPTSGTSTAETSPANAQRAQLIRGWPGQGGRNGKNIRVTVRTGSFGSGDGPALAFTRFLSGIEDHAELLVEPRVHDPVSRVGRYRLKVLFVGCAAEADAFLSCKFDDDIGPSVTRPDQKQRNGRV